MVRLTVEPILLIALVLISFLTTSKCAPPNDASDRDGQTISQLNCNFNGGNTCGWTSNGDFQFRTFAPVTAEANGPVAPSNIR